MTRATQTPLRRNWAREARRRGWDWDEGGPHWFRPSTHPFHHAGDYAKTAKEAVENFPALPWIEEAGAIDEAVFAALARDEPSP